MMRHGVEEFKLRCTPIYYNLRFFFHRSDTKVVYVFGGSLILKLMAFITSTGTEMVNLAVLYRISV